MKNRMLLAAVSLLACAQFGLGMRREAQASGSVTEDPLSSAMVRLGRGAYELDRLMGQSEAVDRRRQGEILKVLTTMRDTIQSPVNEEWRSNHPLIDVDLESFRRDLERARARAAGNPPNYFWAGSVSGACVHCHGGEL